MDKIFLFTDGSVNTKSKTGYGAYLAVTNTLVPPKSLNEQVKIRRFDNTSSTRLELEKNKFKSGKGRPLKNSDLYIQFYKMADSINCEFIKVQGHTASRKKDDIDRLFTLVDRESRRALRKYNQAMEPVT